MGAEGLKVRGGGDLVVNKVGPKLRYWVQLLLPPDFFQENLSNILTKNFNSGSVLRKRMEDLKMNLVELRELA